MWANMAGGLAGAGVNAFASYMAAQAQKEAAQKAAAARASGLKTASSYLDPYSKAGQNAVLRYSNLIGANGADAATAAMKDFQTSPGYQFRLDQGQRALDNGAAARGMLLSGQQTKAAQQYGQDYASNEFGNYVQRYLPLMQGGQSAANSMAGYATGIGDATAGGYAGVGDANAAMWGGVGNAVNGAVQNSLYSYQKDQGMSNLADLLKKYGAQ